MGTTLTTTIGASLGFTEGPLWLPSGELLVTSMSRGLVYCVAIDGSYTEIAAETGGGPNGLALGPDGAVYVAQNGNATIQSKSPRPVNAGIQAIRDGVVDDIVVSGCSAPNDLVFGPDGLLWFTDPGHPEPCIRTLDLFTGRVEKIIQGVPFPNGVAFGLDPDELYVADSERGDIVKFRRSRGSMGEPKVHAQMPGASPDGIAFDRDGNLFVAAFATDEVVVFDPNGDKVATLPTGRGSKPTNICFAGASLDKLVVTAASGGRVLVLDGKYNGRSPSPWLE